MQWGSLLRQSMFFLSVQHGFRLATEPGTREGTRGSYFKGYLRSLRNLHGWADGDPFYVNFIGHPMQGAVSGNLWLQNDPRYRRYEIGKDPRYWKGRVRALTYSFAYSTQFEIGPLSEASIGQIQSHYPQVGFVDHVVTPVIGTGWQIGEDWIDRFVIRRIEDRVSNAYVRMFVRGGLNPARSMANLMAGKPPWHRYTRSGVLVYGRRSGDPLDVPPPPYRSNGAPGAIPRITFTAPANFFRFGSTGCAGGSGVVSYHVGGAWNFVGEVGGCKMFGLEENVSGDSLTYMVGPGWSHRSEGRWWPRSHILIGGHKLTREQIWPVKRRQLLAAVENPDFRILRPQFTDVQQVNAVALALGAGVDVDLNRVVALRVADLQYLHTWVPSPQWEGYRHGIRFSSGIVFRVGAW
ncbi:MAG: hypothetical protein SFV51_10080 [Bryobacteraceae bacterium]|nr:hypothetical protein [Bryobacteraceae bacterium]